MNGTYVEPKLPSPKKDAQIKQPVRKLKRPFLLPSEWFQYSYFSLPIVTRQNIFHSDLVFPFSIFFLFCYAFLFSWSKLTFLLFSEMNLTIVFPFLIM